MKEAAEGSSPFASPLDAPPAARQTWMDRFEGLVERASEWLNPILVKESRQALKSRQFIITFSLLLICGWGWSLAGVAMLSQAAYYAPGGRFMLIGYFLILCVPLTIIVPFSAFRSLAAEREDGTFELLSITSLRSRQIVSGKLGSAFLQIAVYYSALAPCIAFTYMLRGVDMLTIGLLLSYAFLASLLLSQFGLLVATITRSSHWQILLSVLLILFLAWCDFVLSYILVGLMYSPEALIFDNIYFWIGHLAGLSLYVSFVVLFLYAAAAQISFISDNRSTTLRWIMVVQQLLWVGWISYAAYASEEPEILIVLAPMAGLYWFVAGSLLSGESAQLSPRVKRTLPQSFLGRSLLTWFNPGSGTGYVFGVLNMASLVIIACAGGFAGQVAGHFGTGEYEKLVTSATLCLAYVAIYVGIARLIVTVLRLRFMGGLIITLLIGTVMGILGIFVPLVLEGWFSGFSRVDYTVLQASNWIWTISNAMEGKVWTSPEAPLVVYFGGMAIFLMNLISAVREVEHVRAATPQRVLEDSGLDPRHSVL